MTVVGVSRVDQAAVVHIETPGELDPTLRVGPCNQRVPLVVLVTQVETDSSETAYLTTLVVAVVELDRLAAPSGMFRVDGLVSVVWVFGFRSFQH
jgi:hypothetical protein